VADRVVGDGDTVTLGGVTLTAHLTPGHTRGCTTWTTAVDDGGRRLDVVFCGGMTLLPGVRLVNNPAYPEIADDFRASFRALRALPCDVFLAPHGAYFSLGEKARTARSGASPNPFIDPAGFKDYVDRSERTFLNHLSRERPEPGTKPG
jgi:metallo-beta-lactamase class B